MKKRIDTFVLVSALGIYGCDITLISVLKDKVERDGEKGRENGLVRCMDEPR
jgi:hypothetical protein